MIEVMNSIAILAVIVAVGIPTLGNLYSRNHTRAMANMFHDDLRDARYDSRTRSNDIITFCAIASPVKNETINCSTTEGYVYGWLWFTGTTLLGKNYGVVDTGINVTPVVNFRVEMRKGQVPLWNRDVEPRTEIDIPFDLSGTPTFPAIAFSDNSGRRSIVEFDATGRTTVTHTGH